MAYYCRLREVSPPSIPSMMVVKKLSPYALPKFDELDVSAWDLSGVEVAGLAAFAWAKPRGTLRLPRVQRVETTFITKGDLTRLELGNNGNTLKRVEPFVCNSFRELVLGCASGCKEDGGSACRAGDGEPCARPGREAGGALGSRLPVQLACIYRGA